MLAKFATSIAATTLCLFSVGSFAQVNPPGPKAQPSFSTAQLDTFVTPHDERLRRSRRRARHR